MASEVFGYKDTWGGGLKSPDSAGFMFNERDLALVQQWNVQYQQTVTPLFECGSSKIYFAAKHASGTCSLGRVVTGGVSEGPQQPLSKQLGTVCEPGEAQIVATEGCEGSSSTTTLYMHNTILSGVGYSGQAQNAYVSEDVQIMFASLDV